MGQSSRQPVPSSPSYLALLQADEFTRFIEKLERGDSPESAAEANGVFQFFLLRGNIGMAYAWRNQYLPSDQPLDADTLKVAISAGGEAFDFIVELYPGLLISALVQQSEGLREQLMELLDMHSDLFFRAKALIYIAGDALQQELGPLLDVALHCRDEILLSQLQSLAPRCVPQSLYELLSHDASYEFSYLEAAETQYWDLFFWKLSVGDVVR